MCIDSGVRDMKSKIRAGSWRKVTGSGLREWITSGNLIASRMKNTPRLFPTRSQLRVKRSIGSSPHLPVAVKVP
jgi:hypothetical protein